MSTPPAALITIPHAPQIVFPLKYFSINFNILSSALVRSCIKIFANKFQWTMKMLQCKFPINFQPLRAENYFCFLLDPYLWLWLSNCLLVLPCDMKLKPLHLQDMHINTDADGKNKNRLRYRCRCTHTLHSDAATDTVTDTD